MFGVVVGAQRGHYMTVCVCVPACVSLVHAYECEFQCVAAFGLLHAIC